MTTCIHRQQSREFHHDSHKRIEPFSDRFAACQRPDDFLEGCAPRVPSTPLIKLRKSWIAANESTTAGKDVFLPSKAETSRAPSILKNSSRKPAAKNHNTKPLQVSKRGRQSVRKPEAHQRQPPTLRMPTNSVRALYHSNEFEALDQPTSTTCNRFHSTLSRKTEPTTCDELEDVELGEAEESEQLVRLDAAKHVRPSRMNSSPSVSCLGRPKRCTPKRNVSFSDKLLRTKVVPRYIDQLNDDDADWSDNSWSDDDDDDVLDDDINDDKDDQEEEEAHEQLKQQRALEREQLREMVAKTKIEPTRRTPRRTRSVKTV